MDVGSDHAALPVSLFIDNAIISAVISDVNEKPLDRARREAEKAGIAESCIFVLSDGFEKIDANSFDTAAICGMGGTLIVGILQKAAEQGKLKKDHILIIQPMTDCELVRKYLWDNGYEIAREEYSLEGKYDEDFKKNKARPYVVLKAVFDGKKHGYTFRELFFGRQTNGTTAFKAFKEKVRRSLAKKLKGILVSLKAREGLNNKRYKIVSKTPDELPAGGTAFDNYIKRRLLK